MKTGQIIAHRGLWKQTSNPHEPNSLEALSAALGLGFGVEFDIRDYQQKLVISHDPPQGNSPLLSELAKVDISGSGVMAVNIKSDGLLKLDLEEMMNSISSDFFFFDMSAPERFQYEQEDLRTAYRLSEFEREIQSKGDVVWVDSFVHEWYVGEMVMFERLANYHEKVVVVSPELHGRKHERAWGFLLNCMERHRNIYICTDYPQQYMALSARK